jgi:integrase
MQSTKISDLADLWLRHRLDAGIRSLTFSSYRTALKSFARMAGERDASSITLQDLVRHRASLLESVSQGTAKVRWDVAIAFVRWAQDNCKIPQFPIPRDLRRMRGSPPFRRVFSPGEIARMIDRSCSTMRCCILLGLNLGYGNRDCARLRPRHVSESVVDAPRHKTGSERRGWLWPETKEALASVGLPITNLRGREIVSDGQDYIRPRMRKLLADCGIPSNGRGFYSLRRSYRTAVDDHWDRPAIDVTMGHATPGMGSRYVAWISDDRLHALSVHARQRLLQSSG